MKAYYYIIIFFFSGPIFCTAQERLTADFGNPTQADYDLTTYPADPDATGVVLFESGYYYADVINDYIRLVNVVHVKIKVLDAKNFEHATIDIPFYKDKSFTEKITHFKAVTHNQQVKIFVKEDAVFDTDFSEHWAVRKFTFPNVQDGSILEYTYHTETPYFARLEGWEFQGELPKLYSEFHTKIPGNYNFNKVLYGPHKLYINEASVKKYCFKVPGIADPADCRVSTYAMKNVPAFKEENFMLSKKNYLSRIAYEMIEYTNLEGITEKFTKTWKDVDKQFKYDKDFGRQLKYDSYFEEKLPAETLRIADELERATAVYDFIQKTFTWNGNYRTLSDIRVKDAFEKQSGNNSEINFSLYNALTAAGIDAKLVLISTRSNGLPVLLYPVMTDFNFVVVRALINGQSYLLDATNKNTPFGVLPFRDLNVRGRLMDFQEGSSWIDILPYDKNTHYVNAKISAAADGNFTGSVDELHTGHIAVEKREELENSGDLSKAKAKQNRLKRVEVQNYTIENENENSEPLKEAYEIILEPDLVGDKVYLNLFFIENYFSKNPFVENERAFPIDFGFPVANTYLISIDLKDVYTLETLPANTLLKLSEKQGEVAVAYNLTGTVINIRLSVRLNQHAFSTEAYNGLKQYFAAIATAQSQPIVLKTL